MAAAAAALVGCIAIFASGASAGGTDTKVTIKEQSGDFSGTVKSSKPAKCADERKVNLMKQKPGKDKKVASDTASLNGDKYEWSTGNTGLNRGKFYAKAPRISGCDGAKSKVIKL